MAVSAGRDLEVEQTLSPKAQGLVQAMDDARRALARAQGHSWVGRVRWQNLYDYLSSDDPAQRLEAFAYIEEQIAQLQAQIPKAQRAAARQREQDAWEAQAREVERGLSPDELERDLAGEDVWLWHGTSTTLWPEIQRLGLLVEPQTRAEPETTPGYVYLTADPDHARRFYARRAASVFGGDPLVLRVAVPWDELSFDEDDADIPSGQVQFRMARDVLPGEILEADGERVV